MKFNVIPMGLSRCDREQIKRKCEEPRILCVFSCNQPQRVLQPFQRSARFNQNVNVLHFYCKITSADHFLPSLTLSADYLLDDWILEAN